MGCGASTPRVPARPSAYQPRACEPVASSPIADLPRELVHVLARFVPMEAPRLARANRTLWQRFSSDRFLWAEMLRCGARVDVCRLLALCPDVCRAAALQLAEPVFYARLSADGRRIAYSTVAHRREMLMQRVMRVVETSSGREVSAFDHGLYVDIPEVCLSPDGAWLAFHSDAQCVFLSLAVELCNAH